MCFINVSFHFHSCYFVATTRFMQTTFEINISFVFSVRRQHLFLEKINVHSLSVHVISCISQILLGYLHVLKWKNNAFNNQFL